MSRFWPLCLVLATAACSGGAMLADRAEVPGAGCPGVSSTVRLTVSPASLARGAATELVVEWALDTALNATAFATLVSGAQDEIEVVVELLEEGMPTHDWTYRGRQLNPYGNGAPAGVVAVVATSQKATGCSVAPSATTSFTLE